MSENDQKPKDDEQDPTIHDPSTKHGRMSKVVRDPEPAGSWQKCPHGFVRSSCPQCKKPKRIDMRVGKHVKKKPEDLMPKEERAALSRECGAQNDGSKNRGISNAERAAVRHLIATRALDAARDLGNSGFRIRGDIRGEAARKAATTLGEVSLTQMTNALLGKISKDKINAILKASVAMREEVCDPLVKEQRISGGLTLEQLVSQAAAKAKAAKGK